MKSGISRREFVGTTAAGLAAMAATGHAAASAVPGGFEMPTFTKARVLRLFIGAIKDWPKPGLDIDEEVKRLRAGIDAAPGVEDIEFVGDVHVRNAKALAPVLEQYKDKEVDGILAVQVCMGIREILNMLTDTGIPTITFHVP